MDNCRSEEAERGSSAPGDALSDNGEANPTRAESAKQRQAAYLTTLPTSVRTLFGKAFERECSPRAAIKAACLQCTNFERTEIANCSTIRCQLREFRPFQGGATE